MDSKIYVPTYDRKQSHFEKLREKFKAYYYTRGCGQSMMKNDEIHLPTAMTGKFSEDKNIEKVEKRAVSRNTKAMALNIYM